MSKDELDGIDYILNLETRNHTLSMSGGSSLTGTQLSMFLEMLRQRLSALQNEMGAQGDESESMDSEATTSPKEPNPDFEMDKGAGIHGSPRDMDPRADYTVETTVERIARPEWWELLEG